jgi:hypothetical protein
MLRTLEVTTSPPKAWPGGGLPSEVAGLVGPCRVSIDGVLVLLAWITSPVVSWGFNLSDLWAWLRYRPALGPGPDLRLRPEWKDVDFHQKTILADDFGMGFGVAFLVAALGVEWCAPAIPVLRCLGNRAGLAPAVRRLGKEKTPDFVCLDNRGRVIVVECKGTQSSRRALSRQIADGHVQKSGPPLLAAVLPVWRRFVVGLFVPKAGAREQAELRVEDPPIHGDDGGRCEDEDSVTPGEMQSAIAHCELASLFRLVGAPALANAFGLATLDGPEEFTDEVRQEIDKLAPVVDGHRDVLGTRRVLFTAPFGHVDARRAFRRIEAWAGVRAGVLETIKRSPDTAAAVRALSGGGPVARDPDRLFVPFRERAPEDVGFDGEGGEASATLWTRYGIGLGIALRSR